MSYTATVVKVMIASPGDVAQERKMIPEVIEEWNAVNSADKGIVLLPAAWETHSAPRMGDRAQSVINKQVLKDCDLLIGVFWTRIGTPTGEAASGTVEEIEEHIKAGKPAMLYFSSVPVVLDSIDQAQYSELQKFKKKCESEGLIHSYESLSDFRIALARQLSITINTDEYIKKCVSDAGLSTSGLTPDAPEEPPAGPSLPSMTKEAKILLVEASLSSDGMVMTLRHMGGLIVQTNSKGFVPDGDVRAAAIWEGAVHELLNLGYLQPRGHKGEVFSITREGYEAADLLKESME
jgi:hypothetical protein